MDKDSNFSPITYVLGQIKISPLLSIKNYLPQLQEAIRHEFPNFNEVNMQAFEIKPSAQPEMRTFTQWHFFDIKSTTGILLETDTIMIHTSDYIDFHTLIDSLQHVLVKFNDILRISGYTRIGLRYNNVIKTDPQNYLEPELLAFYVKGKAIFKEDKFFGKTETMQETTSGFIKIQSAHLSRGFSQNSLNNLVSSDLVQSAGYLSFEHIQQPTNSFVVLDLDHFSPNKKEEFNVKKILDEFKQLYEGAKEAFFSSITENALREWSLSKS
jgi:uncharacterized protein (TIGR04255 family)